jgi:uncharacterized protein YecE (DUF72 family)
MPKVNDDIDTPQNLLIGVGGWAYLPIKKGNKLEVCSKIYDFVEVNSTFYSLPEIERVKKWKQTVPANFEFTLRANRELTHLGMLKPTAKNFKIYEKMLAVSNELDAKVIHFQFPPSLEVTNNVVKDWRDFFASVSSSRGSGNPKFALEIRNEKGLNSPEVSELVEQYDIIPTEDASKDSKLETSPRTGILYTRVFGQGDHTKWSFDTQELKDLETKVTEVKARKRYVTFHNLTMYEDASRMKTIVKSGNDQKQALNSPMGLESLKRVIASGRVKYPTTRQALIEEYGWRVFDLEPQKRSHVEDELRKLDDNRSYESVEEVVSFLTGK